MTDRDRRSVPGPFAASTILTVILIAAAVIFVSLAVFMVLELWIRLGGAAQKPLHDVTEILYFLSGIGLFATALGALAFARQQVHQANRLHEQSNRSHQATMFLELEKRWKEKPLKQSRQAILDLEQEAEAVLGAGYSSEAMHEILERVRKDEPERYERIMRIAIFLETIGLMAREDRGFVEEDHIYALFFPVIERLRSRFDHHFQQRFEEWKRRHVEALLAQRDATAVERTSIERISYRTHEEGTYANVLYIFDICEERARAKLPSAGR